MSTVGFPVYSLLPIDPKTGQWTREWWLFLQYIWNRTGGSEGQSSSDLSADMPEDAGVEEMKAAIFSLANEVGQIPPNIPTATVDDVNSVLQSLMEQVFVLQIQIDGLNQGPSL